MKHQIQCHTKSEYDNLQKLVVESEIAGQFVQIHIKLTLKSSIDHKLSGMV